MAERGKRDRRRERLVKIAVVENGLTGEHIRQRLEAAGIACLVKNTDPLGVIYGVTSPFAVQVFVLEGDELSALAALQDADPAILSAPGLPPRRRYRRRS